MKVAVWTPQAGDLTPPQSRVQPEVDHDLVAPCERRELGGCFGVAVGASGCSLCKAVAHRRTRPQAKGKLERFTRTLAAECADADTHFSDEARAATYPDWLHSSNHHRPHTGIGGEVPADRVHSLTGNFT